MSENTKVFFWSVILASLFGLVVWAAATLPTMVNLD